MGIEELQLQGIKEEDIDDNDVLLGRGGKTNHHPGNASYLKLIEAREVEYMFLESRTEKTEYAMKFVQQLRKEGIRFLKKDPKNGKLWNDVGDVKMREKVSQNLRERQPKLKKQFEQQRQHQEIMGQPQSSPIPSMQKPTIQHLSPVANNNNNNNNNNGMGMPLPVYSSSPNPNANNNNNIHQNNMQQFLHMQAMAKRNQEQSQLMMQQMMQQQQQQGQMGNYGVGSGSGHGYPNMVPSDGGMPYGAGGAMIQGDGTPLMMNNNNYGNNFNNNNNNNAYAGSQQLPVYDPLDQREADLLQGMGANDHPLALSRAQSTESQLLSPEEDSKLRAAEALPSGRPQMIQRGRSTDFGLPITDVPGMEIFAAMGSSTTSLLDSLEVDPVPEEQEGDLSPKRTATATIGSAREQFTPVMGNRRMIPPLTRDNSNNNSTPAMVSPTPTSPQIQGGGMQQQQPQNVLDDNILQAWANSNDGGDALSPFMQQQQQPPMPSRFRRTQSHQVEGVPRPTAAPMRRSGTAPAPTMPQNSYELSPRPGAMTKDKRATSNVAETPETRGYLVRHEGGGGLPMELPFSEDAGPRSVSGSSTFSLKKASLGRDKSEQSRLLKQQCMPNAFAANAFTAGGMDGSSNGTAPGGWLGAGFNADPPLTPPVSAGKQVDGASLQREYTPRTYGMMQDFGKLSVHGGGGMRSGETRTANRFEDTIASRSNEEAAQSADQIPMDLMIKKPAMMTWRNRSTTMNALDLDGLDDDPVLLGEDDDRRTSRASMNSIAGMWTNTSAEFDAFVSDLAGQPVNNLVLDLPTLGGEASKTANLKV
ncbi:expressed unknown protein [Seminavis robusta]|uniref:DUF6824 domain-containing protein n=1 Tax=Seminavis robusta TaxID=568900 RepID=A0A9N8DAQ8_9STRA|nr:expressed unknown protein [Seminavis robusta]|eukprot:Sro3_g002390.1 n/a (815) ;mRNA; f:137472-140487